MRRAGALLATGALLLGLGGTLGAAKRPVPNYANPSAIIAVESAFSRAAREHGAWKALEDFAAPDAFLFRAGLVSVSQGIKGQREPASAPHWEPYELWSSCDGSLVASHGALDGHAYTTLWQRQPKKGDYKWLVTFTGSQAQPGDAPEMLSAHVADCPPRGTPRPPVPLEAVPQTDPAHRFGQANDGTLRWDVSVTPQGTRHLRLWWKKDGAEASVLDETASGAN